MGYHAISRPDQAAAGRPSGHPPSQAVSDRAGLLVPAARRPPGGGPGDDLTAAEVAAVLVLAGRAPSLHNTQPWRFRPLPAGIELLADPGRQLPVIDPERRELTISCGAALFGLRLGLRSIGRLADTQLRPENVPERVQSPLLARVLASGRAALTADEAEMVAAVPHRHTHRGAFSPIQVPPRLLDQLTAEAAAEGCELVLVTSHEQQARLAEITRRAAAQQQASPQVRAELARWVRPVGSSARDGVPARALAPPPRPDDHDDDLPRRDFGWPGAEQGVTDPAAAQTAGAVAVLMSAGDSATDWLRAGQALNRLLLRAASRWVFASLQSQPLELPAYRVEVRTVLGGDGWPQMLLQLGRANVAPATPRRPRSDLVTNDPAD